MSPRPGSTASPADHPLTPACFQSSTTSCFGACRCTATATRASRPATSHPPSVAPPTRRTRPDPPPRAIAAPLAPRRAQLVLLRYYFIDRAARRPPPPPAVPSRARERRRVASTRAPVPLQSCRVFSEVK